MSEIKNVTGAEIESPLLSRVVEALGGLVLEVEEQDPRHADALLVTGICTRQAERRLVEVYTQTPKPCVVFCIGSCAMTGGIFRHAYHFSRPVDEVIREVDPDAIIAYVPGCPPKPEAMIAGAVTALGTL